MTIFRGRFARSASYPAFLVMCAAFPSCSETADDSDALRTATPAAAEIGIISDTAKLGNAEMIVDPWKRAAASIRHLSPVSFGEVPLNVRNRLFEVGCSVPQAFYPSTPHNVISGDFAARGQIDWAALCTRGDSAGLFVIWGGPSRCPSPIGWAPNADFLQGIGEGKIGYSRAISVASMAFILEHAREYDGPAPPSTDHSGINDAFMEKGSGVHFCSDGTWFSLQGAD